MLVVSTWLQPSAISHTLRCYLTRGDQESLVVAKVNRLEVYDLTADGLAFQCSFDTWATVTSLLRVHRKTQATCSLVITTDHPNPELHIVDYNSEVNGLIISHTVALKVRTDRESEMFDGAIIHPNGRVIVCCQFSGTVKVVVLAERSNAVEKAFECHIPELNIMSLCFIPTSGSKLLLGVLSVDHNSRKHLVARELKLDEEELLYQPSTAIASGFVHQDATTLIPVPGQRKVSGVLVLGGRSCHFFGSEKAASKRASTTDPIPAVQSLHNIDLSHLEDVVFTALDDDRWIVGDNNGHLLMLGVERNGPGHAVSNILSVDLGIVNPVASLAHLDGPFVYVGSLQGDSQVIRLLPLATVNTSRSQVIKSYTNIGPILDAALVEDEMSGQSRIVTCSGESTSGSLRSIQSGAELQTLAAMEGIPNVERIFPLRTAYGDSSHSVALVTTPFSTMVIELTHSGMNQLDRDSYPGFIRDKRTLAACSTASAGTCIQVTTSGIHFVDMLTNGTLGDRWPLPGSPAVEITAADVNPTQVCIATKGGNLLYFDARGSALKLVHRADPSFVAGLPNEVVSISIAPTYPDNLSSPHVAVGYWINNTVKLCSLPRFTPIFVKGASTTAFIIKEQKLPETLLIHSFASEKGVLPYLLVGLADGSLVTYIWSEDGLIGRRVVGLGPPQRVNLLACSSEQAGPSGTVLAVGARGSVLWYDSKSSRLRHSSVAIKNSTAVCSVDYPGHHQSILLSSNVSTSIVRLKKLDERNITTIHLGRDIPRSITHIPLLDAFAVGIVRANGIPGTGTETVASFIRIVHDATFEGGQTMSKIPCLPNEEIVSMKLLELGSSDSTKPYLVVGTTMTPAGDSNENTEGRMLVLFGEDPRQINIVSGISVPGCVYGLAAVGGCVVASVNSTVTVFGLGGPKGPFDLTPRAKWERGYLIVALTARGNQIAVADQLRSTVLLEYKGEKLRAIAYNQEPRWPITVETVNDTDVISSDLYFNVGLFRTASDNLERVGGIQYGELINKFVVGSFAPFSALDPIRPRFVVITATGRISVISEMDDHLSLRASALQDNMAHLLTGPGEASFTKYRTPRGPRGEENFAGFIDGDFIRRYTDLTHNQRVKIQGGYNSFSKLDGTLEDTGQVVELLSSTTD